MGAPAREASAPVKWRRSRLRRGERRTEPAGRDPSGRRRTRGPWSSAASGEPRQRSGRNRATGMSSARVTPPPPIPTSIDPSLDPSSTALAGRLREATPRTSLLRLVVRPKRTIHPFGQVGPQRSRRCTDWEPSEGEPSECVGAPARARSHPGSLEHRRRRFLYYAMGRSSWIILQQT